MNINSIYKEMHLYIPFNMELELHFSSSLFTQQLGTLYNTWTLDSQLGSVIHLNNGQLSGQLNKYDQYNKSHSDNNSYKRNVNRITGERSRSTSLQNK